jgi:hypothetical protein
MRPCLSRSGASSSSRCTPPAERFDQLAKIAQRSERQEGRGRASLGVAQQAGPRHWQASDAAIGKTHSQLNFAIDAAPTVHLQFGAE